ncbi:hypothetical protein FHS87_002673 [Roseomonas pecuniae]|uniref:Uncharacterized protein n=1 Tax=Muricoccus pecuniae TaxID=693023 RepID=A0A840YEJ8_9PROT|nr:hypothetical protein [Roseomonas pecuniae]
MPFTTYWDWLLRSGEAEVFRHAFATNDGMPAPVRPMTHEAIRRASEAAWETHRARAATLAAHGITGSAPGMEAGPPRSWGTYRGREELPSAGSGSGRAVPL